MRCWHTLGLVTFIFPLPCSVLWNEVNTTHLEVWLAMRRGRIKVKIRNFCVRALSCTILLHSIPVSSVLAIITKVRYLRILSPVYSNSFQHFWAYLGSPGACWWLPIKYHRFSPTQDQSLILSLSPYVDTPSLRKPFLPPRSQCLHQAKSDFLQVSPTGPSFSSEISLLEYLHLSFQTFIWK